MRCSRARSLRNTRLVLNKKIKIASSWSSRLNNFYLSARHCRARQCHWFTANQSSAPKTNFFSPHLSCCHSCCSVLAWKVHPPTANSFTKHLLFLLPHEVVTTEVRYDVLELTRFQLELCVIDYFFVMHRPSTVALAALLNAMESVKGVPESAIKDLDDALVHVTGLDQLQPEIQECRDRLQLLYSQSGYDSPEREVRGDVKSPVCVSHGVNHHEVYFPQGDLIHVQEESKQDVLNFSVVAQKNETHVLVSDVHGEIES